MEDVLKWLDEFPLPEEILTNEDGSKYLPIAVVKSKLDLLTNKGWQTKNFNHFIFNQNGNYKVYGSLEVYVEYYNAIDKIIIFRNLVGAATFDIKDYKGNPHWSATLKSLCMVNAVQDLGKQFGQGLNPEFESVPVIQVDRGDIPYQEQFNLNK